MDKLSHDKLNQFMKLKITDQDMEEDNQLFEVYTLPRNIQAGFKRLFDEGELCDFTICCEEKEFLVHKCILAASSDYFKAMFRPHSLESKQEKAAIQGINSSIMEILLNFIYTSEIRLDNHNIQDILIAASILQMNEVRNLCSEYMEARIDVSNCLGVLTVANECNLDSVTCNAYNFCLGYFESIIREKELPDLDERWLVKLISDNELNVRNEEVVFQAIRTWIDADKAKRRPKLYDLLSHVRLSFIEPPKLVEMSNDEYIRECSRCRDLMDEEKNQIILRNYSLNESTISKYQRRGSRRKSQRIFSAGGWTDANKSIASVEEYDPYLDTWVEISPMTIPRCGVGVAILDDILYAVGGHDGQNYLKNVECYDIRTKTWSSSIPDMKYERTSVCVVALDGYIYAIGGQLHLGPTDVVERYNPETRQWTDCAPLRCKRLGAGVTVLNGYIYVIGGASSSHVLDTCEVYDPSRDRWYPTVSMLTGRKHLGCTSYKGKIYAVGGRSETSELETGESFDPSTGTWSSIPSMATKRSGIGLVEFDGFLYAVGGHDGDIRLNLVEAYDLNERRWTTKKSMIHERLGVGLAVHKRGVSLGEILHCNLKRE